MRGFWPKNMPVSRPDKLKKSGRNGFTLIELLIAVSIIAVLGVIALVSYGSAQKKSRDARRKADLEQIRQALEMYRADNSAYPSNVGAASFTQTSNLNTPLVTSGYMPLIPDDPLGGTYHYYYRTDKNTNNIYVSYCLSALLESPDSSYTNICPATSNAPYTGQNYVVANP